MTKKQAAEQRVVRAAMRVHRTWKNHSYYNSGAMYDAVARMGKACESLARSRKARA